MHFMQSRIVRCCQMHFIACFLLAHDEDTSDVPENVAPNGIKKTFIINIHTAQTCILVYVVHDGKRSDFGKCERHYYTVWCREWRIKTRAIVGVIQKHRASKCCL